MFEALNNNRFHYDHPTQMYYYSNLKYPNKNYKKTFKPKEFMVRGDVINFGGGYRNENKMIFDGNQLQNLYTEIDDYGSVPPYFVAGDNPGDFNIGDFEESIDHNTVNWLSKDKLKEIEIYEINANIWGKVKIKGKEWKIYFSNINEQSEFNYNVYVGRTFSYNIENDIIIITTPRNNKYVIKSQNQNLILELKQNLVLDNNQLSIISFDSKWFVFKIIKEYSLIDNNNVIQTPNFPIICVYNYGQS